MKLKPKKTNIQNALDYLNHYLATYPRQYNYEKYSDEVFIEDILYGLGVAIGGEKYMFAIGFDKFKEVLREHLERKSHHVSGIEIKS